MRQFNKQTQNLPLYLKWARDNKKQPYRSRGVMLHIRLKNMNNISTCKQKEGPYKYSRFTPEMGTGAK